MLIVDITLASVLRHCDVRRSQNILASVISKKLPGTWCRQSRSGLSVRKYPLGERRRCTCATQCSPKFRTCSPALGCNIAVGYYALSAVRHLVRVCGCIDCCRMHPSKVIHVCVCGAFSEGHNNRGVFSRTFVICFLLQKSSSSIPWVSSSKLLLQAVQ